MYMYKKILPVNRIEKQKISFQHLNYPANQSHGPKQADVCIYWQVHRRLQSSQSLWQCIPVGHVSKMWQTWSFCCRELRTLSTICTELACLNWLNFVCGLALYSIVWLTVCCSTHMHTQPFNGLWSRTTRVGRYQKKHPLTHILIIGHPLSTCSIYYDP